MEFSALPKPNSALTRDTFSSRNSSSERLSIYPETLLSPRFPSEQAESQQQHHSQQDHVLRTQILTQHYKQLATQLTRYQNKSSPTARCNHLRLTLLKFLRSETQLSLPPELESLPSRTVTKVGVCVAQGVKVFTSYWLALLSELFKCWNSISFVDKTCYLECISRIMSRNEWIHVQESSVYQDLLVLTLNLIFKKLFNLKILSLNLNAFIGKVFCFAYIYVPRFAELLLFSLYVKNRSIHKFASYSAEPDFTNESAYPKHLMHLINWKGDDTLKADTDPALLGKNCMEPPRVTTFVIKTVDEDPAFTDVLEQYDELKIDLRDTVWVKRWAGFDSDVFKSFLKHFLEISLFYQQFQIDMDKDDSNKLPRFVEGQPGGIIIYSHILQIFHSNYKMLRNFKRCQYKDNLGQNANANIEMVAFYTSNKKSNAVKNYQLYLSELPFLRFFHVLETLIYSSTYIDINLIIKYFETIQLSKAKEISPFNPDDCEVMYDILLQFCLKLNNNSKQPLYSNVGQAISNNDLLVHINWEFWVVGLIQMINTENMICIAKSLSSLFNLWEIIPSDFYFDQESSDAFSAELAGISKNLQWISNRNHSLLFNLSMFLISDPVWQKSFIHWQPLIRHFYYRLLVFKIVGPGDRDDVFNKIVLGNLNQTYDLFIYYHEKNKEYNPSLLKFEMFPSMPIFNKKLIITHFINDQSSKNNTPTHLSASSFQSNKKNNSYVNVLEKFNKDPRSPSLSKLKNSYSSSALVVPPSINSKRMYSYDIFDDAIYSSSTASSSPYSSQNTTVKSPSLQSDSSNISGSQTSRSFSKTSMSSVFTTTRRSSSPTSSPKSYSRTLPTSSLKKVPIISSALSFFKKVNESISNEHSTTVESSKTTLKPPINSTQRTSPILQTSIYFGPSSRSPSTPSSFSEISDDENFQNQIQNSQLKSPSLNIPKHRALPPQQSAPTSRVSSTTSLISMISGNSQTTATNIKPLSNGNTTANSISMDSIPPPPELFIKIPPAKSFKYKYQLVFSNDSFQNRFYLNKIIKDPSKRPGGENGNGVHEKKKLFFGMNEIIEDVDIIPQRPRLPPNRRFKTTGIGLLHSLSLEEEGKNNGSFGPEHALKLNTELSKWLSTSSISSSSSGSGLIKKNDSNNAYDIELYKSENSNLEKNWTILGKVLNEWDLIIEEYEAYLEVLINDSKTELKNDDFFQWFNDPMLVCDIPSTKNMFGEKD